jgi:hypothetical protein
MASRVVRDNSVTVGDVLDGHVNLDLECLDRIYLHGYLGQLQVGLAITLSGRPQTNVRAARVADEHVSDSAPGKSL